MTKKGRQFCEEKIGVKVGKNRGNARSKKKVISFLQERSGVTVIWLPG